MIAGRNKAGWWGMARTLALSGMTALPIVALAGEPQTMPRGAVSQLPAEGPGKPAEARAKLSEIKVALAWLADPATFPCALHVRQVRCAMLELTGTVPSKEVHARALDLANASSDLSILDAITVKAGAVEKPHEGSAVQLNLEATNALMEPGFAGIRDLEVQARPDGEIVVLGSIASYEEKLAASQRLCRVAGCTCVKNQLQVRTVSMTGMPYSVVTADGRLMTPAEALPVPASLAAARPPVPATLTAPAPVPLPSVAHVAHVVPAAASIPMTTPAPAPVAQAFYQEKVVTPMAFVVTPVAHPSQPSKQTPRPAFAVAAVTAAKADTTTLHDWYRRRIAQECGIAPQCVSVGFPTAKTMTVTLRGVDAQAVNRAYVKIAHISELSAYLVKIEVETARP